MFNLKWLLALSLLGGLVRGAGQNRPNFVFILADDQSWNGTSVLMDPQRADSRSDFHRTPHGTSTEKGQRSMVFSAAMGKRAMTMAIKAD
jgi:hypothetical protein